MNKQQLANLEKADQDKAARDFGYKSWRDAFDKLGHSTELDNIQDVAFQHAEEMCNDWKEFGSYDE